MIYVVAEPLNIVAELYGVAWRCLSLSLDQGDRLRLESARAIFRLSDGGLGGPAVSSQNGYGTQFDPRAIPSQCFPD